MPLPPAIRGTLVAACLPFAPISQAQQLFINEIHYDNVSNDVGEFVEIAGPVGTDLELYRLYFYNGATGLTDQIVELSGTIGNEGVRAFFVPGIQNGPADGIAFYDPTKSHVIQFLSYEGTFTAIEGPAAGMTSVDIGVNETNTTPVGNSLQLTGTGSDYADFTWAGPIAETPDAANAGQTFTGGTGPSIILTFAPRRVCEIDGAGASEGMVTLTPAPGVSVTIDLENPDPSEITIPATVEVSDSGSASFPVEARTDGEIDGAQLVTVRASDPKGSYAEDTTDIVVTDADGSPGTGVPMRIATINALNGVGASGTEKFDALVQMLGRIDADVIAFQEVSSSGNFADLKALASAIGFGTTRQFLATEGDAFAGSPYSGGDFGSGQNTAIASRWPILETVQIGRGIPGRKEITRYPIFARIDAPGTENDPVVVNVHLKAGNRNADHFRKAVEAWRVAQFLDERGFHGQCDNVFVVGDVNEDWDNFQPASIFTGVDTSNPGFGDGSTFPQSYLLGADLAGANAITIPFADFPIPAFLDIGVGILPTFDARNVGTRTFVPLGDARLDYVMASTRHASARSEIYNSALDAAFGGLPKSGVPLSGGASSIASDHFLVFADFELDDLPSLDLQLSESGGAVTVSPAPGHGELVTIAFASRGPLALTLPETVTLTGPLDTVAFEAAVRYPSGTIPDGAITVTATAPGHAAGADTLSLRGTAASGLLLFTQYIETASGSAPKAVEILNNAGSDIEFAATPLILYSYFNGTPVRDERIYLDRGSLPAGSVLVIGDTLTGNFLLGQGRIVDPEGELAGAQPGTVFENADGDAAFLKFGLGFNGDDALEVQLGFVRADVFGMPGNDPGSAWTGSGVSTANQNLSLRGNVGTGSSGFTDPSLRWETTASGTNLSGFGISPVLSDPCIAWAESFGLEGIDRALLNDPDKDAIVNLLEYALGGDPTVLSPGILPRMTTAGGFPAISFARRAAPGRLVYEVQTSVDLVTWQSGTTVQEGAPIDNGDGTETVTFRVSALPAGEIHFRVAVTLP